MNYKTYFFIGMLCVSATAPVAGQTPQSLPAALQEGYKEFAEATGKPWMVRINKTTGAARMVYGSQYEIPLQITDDESFFDLAREAMNMAHGMFRIDDITLVEEKVKHLPLARIGTTDKVTVAFHQEVNGVPVVRATVNVLFTEDGKLLSLDSTALTELADFNTSPALSAFAAIAEAQREFVRLEGREAQEIFTPELVIFPEATSTTVRPRLSWSIEMRNHEPGNNGLPSGQRIYVAADGVAEAVGNDQLIHTHMQDIVGQVGTWGTPGVKPDTYNIPEVQFPMPDVWVTSSVGNAQTDANGNFVIPNAGPNPVDVKVTYLGEWVDVNNRAGEDYAITKTFTPGVPGTIMMNGNRGELETGEANGYIHVNEFRRWLKDVDPNDTTMDFQVLCKVSLNFPCNAFYDGNSINHFRRLAGCVNSAYSTVVAHEEGHWANDLYNSFNGPDGFGEGSADIWAMYIYDTPIVGEDFFGPGGHIRTGENTRQFCGSGCYGQVHTDGEVLMGAFWKMRRNLNVTYGNQVGDDISAALFVNWYNAYDQGNIEPLVEEQLLALDDNNGNIFDGTPNYYDIDGAFIEQGFPGVVLQLIDIQHVPLDNTTDEAGPYAVSADIMSLLGANVTGADVIYNVNDGPDMTIPMNNTGGNTYTADIPGQTSVAFIDYYIEARDDQGNTQRLPGHDPFSFYVGIFQQLYFIDFEGVSDEGWTKGSNAGANDFNRGIPNGRAGDPSSAYSGTDVWATDLGRGQADGEYEANTDEYLVSPTFDFTGEFGTHVRFRRWLNVETSIYDRAELLVNGQSVWGNPTSDLFDTSWVWVDYDISAYADDNPSVTFRFELETDGSVEYGGWNIDDFEVYNVGPVNQIDTIQLTGDTNVVVGGSGSYQINAAPADAPFWIYGSLNSLGQTINGQPFDIGLPMKLLRNSLTDSNGNASWTGGPIPPNLAGRTVYLEVRVDSAGKTYDSNALAITVN